MNMTTYNEAMRILDLIEEKVDYAIAQLAWIEYNERLLNGNKSSNCHTIEQKFSN